MSAISFSSVFKTAAPIRIGLQQGSAMIVVPCYNEAKRLNTQAFLDYLDIDERVKLIFVNDGSTDDTLSVLQSLFHARPDRITVLTLSKNSGKAEAVRQGMQFACDLGTELVGYWDADLATPLNAIGDFLRVADRYRSVSVVFGSRRPLLGHRINRTLRRRAVSSICAILARQAIRLPIGDTQCGAKLFRNTMELRESIRLPFSAGWLFDVELFTRLSTNQIDRSKAFYELPLSEWHEIEGSKVSASAIFKSGFQMLKIIFQSQLGIPPRTANLNSVPKVQPLRPRKVTSGA